MAPRASGSAPPAAAALHARLRALAAPGAVPACLVAWSGGLDSTVLLHLLCQLRAAGVAVRAIHVDHGLQEAAVRFRRFCRRLARDWRVPLAVVAVRVRRDAGESLEEAARDARRAALAAALRPGEWLLSGQHADDQLETVLLALLRGAGPAGLAAMPERMPLGAGQLVRPLLPWTRAQLAAYAQAQRVPWSEDPMNAAAGIDRVYLRNRVLPALRERWPGAARTALRSAAHCGQAAMQLQADARRDLANAADGADLEIAVLRRWVPARRAEALRVWLQDAGCRAPETRHLRQIDAMLAARADAHPELRLPGLLLRRHDGRLLLERAAVPALADEEQAPARSWRWRDGEHRLADGSCLAVRADPHGDLDLARLPVRLLVGFAAREPGRTLRKRMQSLDVPAWRRATLPLLFAPGSQARDPRLLAIADLWLEPGVQSTANTVRRGRIFWRAAR